MRAVLWCTQLLLLAHSLSPVNGHGYLRTPTGRGTIGYPNPIDDDHDGTNCGGFDVQKNLGGKCGVCGDPYNGPRKHETGGQFARGIITGRYQAGAAIPIKVHLTTNHGGWFEFRICPATNSKVEVTQQCLDQHLLKFTDGKTRRTVLKNEEWIDLKLQLPKDLVCPRCVLQWKYHAGQHIYLCPDGTNSARCGPQEEFYNCADVSISGTSPTNTGSAVTPKPATGKPPAKPAAKCAAVGVWAKQPAMFTWCAENCLLGNCPADRCAC